MLAALIILLAPASEPLPVLPRPEMILAHVVGCGVRVVDAQYGFDGRLQEDVVKIRKDVRLSVPQLKCLAEASLSSITFIVFEDQRTFATYNRIYYQAEDRRSYQQARVWLRRHQLLAKLPIYVQGRDELGHFAVKLENLCNVPPRSALQAAGRDILTLAPERLTFERSIQLSDTQLACLTSAMAASKIEFGFIGNTARSTQN